MGTKLCAGMVPARLYVVCVYARDGGWVDRAPEDALLPLEKRETGVALRSDDDHMGSGECDLRMSGWLADNGSCPSKPLQIGSASTLATTCLSIPMVFRGCILAVYC